MYNPVTKVVTKNLNKFKDTAYGATFRSDGQLLCAGGEESVVRLFEVNTKSMLRQFRGHKALVDLIVDKIFPSSNVGIS